MLIKKSELLELADNIKKSMNGEQIDFRDNKEGALSILKNDIYSFITLKNELLDLAENERIKQREYISNISHQLKTPITSMSIMADLLSSAPKEKQSEFIHNIKISLSRMEWLTDSLLKMASLDFGNVKFEMSEIPVSNLIENALKSLNILLDIKNQSVELSHDTNLICDVKWSSEALSNLIKNASESSPDNSKIIIDSGENPIYRWVSVTNFGNGIKKEDIHKLFRRFEGSTNENGYGIGLPLALAIIKGQNGDIDLEQGENGKGTTFTVKFFK